MGSCIPLLGLLLKVQVPRGLKNKELCGPVYGSPGCSAATPSSPFPALSLTQNQIPLLNLLMSLVREQDGIDVSGPFLLPWSWYATVLTNVSTALHGSTTFHVWMSRSLPKQEPARGQRSKGTDKDAFVQLWYL